MSQSVCLSLFFFFLLDSWQRIKCGRVDGRVVGGRVRRMGGMACGSTMINIVCVVLIGTNTATPGDTVIGLMTSLLFSL